MARRFSILLMILFPAVFAFAVVKPWYEAYDDALKAINNKNWSAAEQELNYAVSKGPAQGMRRTYGVSLPIQYVPNYYLGIVYANTNRLQDAIRQFDVTDQSLLKPDQRAQEDQFRLQAKTEIENANTRLAVQALTSDLEQRLKNNDLDGAKKSFDQLKDKDPANQALANYQKRITQLESDLLGKEEQAQKNVQFEDLLKKARQALQSKDYKSARNFAQQAAGLGLDTGKSQELLKSIDIAENIEALERSLQRQDWKEADRMLQIVQQNDPGNDQLKTWRKQIADAISALDSQYMAALREFYSGKYESSNNLLVRLLATRKDDPGLYFYSGCANAAISFTKVGGESSTYLKLARKQFAIARQLQANLKVDERFISPKILQIYRESR